MQDSDDVQFESPVLLRPPWRGMSKEKAEEALKQARERHIEGDDAGALKLAEKSLQMGSDNAQRLVDHILRFGWHSEMAQTARRIVEAKDLYAVLQLGHDVTPEAVKKAYHRTSKLVHPDRNKARLSDEAFKRVGEAFHTLNDPGQKQVYDLGLKAACEYCTEVTTRGAMDAHLRVCPQRPTTCAGSAAGCGWSGVAAEQAGHEAACPIAGFQWMAAGVAARVAAQNSQLQAHNTQLQAQNHQMHIQTMQLQAQNEQLQRQGTALQHALQPLVGRVRALEDEAEADGRRQRQRR